MPEAICDAPADHIRYTPGVDKSVFFRSFKEGSALAKAKALGAQGVLDELKKPELSPGVAEQIILPGKSGMPP